MKTERQETGRKGEDEACMMLERMGHVILERNWRSSHLEVDIISRKGEELHFVEVKSRKAPVSAMPEDNVRNGKRKNMAAAALRYLHSGGCPKGAEGMEISFDVVAVILEEGKTRVTYYPNAFIPIYL